MKSFGDIVILDLLETYCEKGEHAFKMVFDPSKKYRNVSVSMKDPDGNQMPVELRKWGKKMSCIFSIDDSISDGVCLINISYADKQGNLYEKILHCWVIK